MRSAALAYGAFLLTRLRIVGALGRWSEVDNLCERFERLMANLPPVPTPLLWDGDQA